MNVDLRHGDCLEVLRTIASDSIDAVVTDPPYGLSFMGKRWDYDVPAVEVWAECLRVLKPGGHLLAFAGTRTQHRMAVRIEDAGFEIRDMIAWVYGSGFPKSRNLSGAWKGWGTALKPSVETLTVAQKSFPPEREQRITLSNLIRLEAKLWLLLRASAADQSSTSSPSEFGEACATAQWTAGDVTNTWAALSGQTDTSLLGSATSTSLSIVSSWRTILEESWAARSTSTTETTSSTTTDWRTLNFSLSGITPESIIRACALPGGFNANASTAERHFNASLSLLQATQTLSATGSAMSQALQRHQAGAVRPNLEPVTVARKPLTGTVAENVQTYGTGALNIDGCRVGRDADDVSGWSQTGSKASENRAMSGGNYARDAKPDAEGRWPANLIHDGGDEAAGLLGEAARFFYCPKASKRDRDEGLEDMERKASGMVPNTSGKHITRRDEGYEVAPRANNHPTVKPTELMRYLCRLVTPPGGVVLDPFMGSGSTGKGAMLEGFRFLGIEREAQYVEIAKARIASAEDKASQPRQATLFQEA